MDTGGRRPGGGGNASLAAMQRDVSFGDSDFSLEGVPSLEGDSPRLFLGTVPSRGAHGPFRV